jgi:hypothetical protein
LDFKNQKIKERPNEICFAGLFHRTSPDEICFAGIFHRAGPENPAKVGKACLAGRQAPQSGANILSGLSVSAFAMSGEMSSRNNHLVKVYLRWARKLGSGFPPNSRTGQPSFLEDKPERLIRPTSQSDSLTLMSAFPSGKSDDPSGWIVGFLGKSTNLLIISDFYSQLVYKYYGVRELTSFGCRFVVDKKFELRSKVCDKHKKRLLPAATMAFYFLQTYSNKFKTSSKNKSQHFSASLFFCLSG